MEDMKFKRGEYVVYGSSGVCLVDDIVEMSFAPQEPKKLYLALKPQTDSNSTVFVPSDNEALCSKMRFVLTKQEIDTILKDSQGLSADWIEDRKDRLMFFKQALSNANPKELITVIHSIYVRDRELAAQNKKLSVTDREVLQSAQRSIREEFAFSLGMDADGVDEYIRSMIELEAAE